MNKLPFIVISAALSINCGDNKGATDDATPTSDSGGFPAAPTLGTQMDRLGRPAINTVLTHGFDGDAAAAGAAKDEYNANSSPGTWTKYAPEFAKNLAILDGLDATCGNQVFYHGMAGGDTANDVADGYSTLAGVLTDDQLYLDTTKALAELPTTHQGYLAVELNAFAMVPNTTCGGRSPTLDVIDTSYTALAIGIGGFDATMQFKPAFGDNVSGHTDVSNTTFPFLGTPHT